MATKQELIGGLEFLIQEGKRMGETMREDDWSKVQDDDGWKNTQVLAHVAGLTTIIVPFVQGMANAGSGSNAAQGVDLNALNAGIVGARESKSVAELVMEIEQGYRGVIDFVKQQPDDFFDQKRSFAGYQDVPLGDLAMRMVVLHGLSHIYGAYTAVAFT